MYRISLFQILIFTNSFLTGIGAAYSRSTNNLYQQEYPTFSVDFNNLKENKRLLESNSSTMAEALEELKQVADASIKKPMRSVVEKIDIPGIEDKHNFVSMGPYWWPDPAKRNGLPYIRKDGKTNPEVRKITDKTYFNELCDIIQKLGLAYFYTKDSQYAKNAIQRLKVWFLDSKTKMNPNLDNGQYIPGRNTGRMEGVIDTRVLVSLIDGIQLLKTSPEWTTEVDQGINEWFTEFLSWLETSKLGIEASKATNNIGTAYYMQVVQINLFLGKIAPVRRYAINQIPKLLDQQIDESGVQIHEIKRTNSWNYSVLNLNYWFNMANMLEHAGYDLWNFKTANGRSLNTAFENLLSYALKQKEWQDKQLRNVDLTNSFNNLYQLSKGKFKQRRLLFFATPKSYTEFERVYNSRTKGPDRLLNKN
ncbi:alginate lyase family protein [Parapedobacter sp. ISTM3]|uniref:alginate lyase family protein n=1 Tax=Parapedobacter sp. ISTM3 TaxID=2800130 RepID=UPI001907656F|nr:alginate lyase family protein [Parapedobacter sp. ISTM3]MBK1438357.1 alginate lyase family protein [Parapedobacter sp. ISTM3]